MSSARCSLVLCAGAIALVCSAPACAFLPALEEVRTAIDGLATVQAALAREREAAARGDALRASPYGYELNLMPLARHEHGAGSYGELESTLMKRLRLPAKTRLDGALAASGEDIAHLALGDARHEGARRLLEAWMAWARAANLALLAEAQRANLAEERTAVARRVALGELAVLDERRAAAALAQAEIALERARLEREQARLVLASEFPALSLPNVAPAIPRPADGAPAADAVERIVDNSHELALARALAARQGVAAARADAEQRPDPSIGLRVLSEADWHEQAIGVVVSIPFAAGNQRASMRAERALTDAIDAEAAGTARRVRLDAEKLVRALPSQYEAWAAAARMLRAAEDALARVEKAWRLGAIDLAELLLARRQAYEARSNELALRSEVQALAARIEVDGHRRWVIDERH